jgi:hypothetical protein
MVSESYRPVKYPSGCRRGGGAGAGAGRAAALWHAERVRGADRGARTAAVAVVVLSVLAIVALAARSDRAGTVTAVAAPTTASPAVTTSGAYKQREREETTREKDTSGGEMPTVLVVVVSLAILGLAAAALLVGALVVRSRVDLPALGGSGPEAGGAAPAPDAVDAARLAAAVRAGLRELADGGPGEGVVACWVLLERAAADAGTHRAQPDTPSELAGRLIDRHDVSPGPLLRLAQLYREARYSRHVLPESARTEARAALEQVAAELAATPGGVRRVAP